MLTIFCYCFAKIANVKKSKSKSASERSSNSGNNRICRDGGNNVCKGADGEAQAGHGCLHIVRLGADASAGVHIARIVEDCHPDGVSCSEKLSGCEEAEQSGGDLPE